MNILKHELRQNFKITVIWIIALVGFCALYISIFSELSAGYADIVKNFPEAFKKTLGITNQGFSTFPLLYAMVLNLTILVGSVQAMNLGTGLISKEVRDKTADFLLTKPVSRQTILTQKFLAGLGLLLFTNLIFIFSAWGLIQRFVDEPFAFKVFFVSSLVLLLIQLFFFCFGYFLGAVLPKIKSVIVVSLPTVFGFFIFSLLDTVIGLEKIKYLTPFRFFDLRELTTGNGYETLALIYLGALLTILVVSSFIIYRNKDIHTI